MGKTNKKIKKKAAKIDPQERLQASQKVLGLLEMGFGRIKKGWVKEDMAVTAKGNFTDAESRSAAKWCLLGSLRADSRWESTPYSKTVGYMAEEKLVKAIGDKKACKNVFEIAMWNDHKDRKKTEVVEVYKKAIDLAKADVASAEKALSNASK